MVKFAKNGSDANDAALRLARAVTGRDLVAYDADAPFLSIHDWFIGNTAMNAGVPEVAARLAIGFRYDDVASIDGLFAEHGRRLAAVILEPCRERRPGAGFLERLRALCDAHGTLLVFDEMVTGFRYALGGAEALLGVAPDLRTVGTAMANGYALTALVGRREYMERGGLGHDAPRCFLLSTTHGAERSALAAGLATIRFYREHGVIDRLYQMGGRLRRALDEAARCHGVEPYVNAWGDFACRPVLRCAGPDGVPSAAYRTLFVQELLRAGVFMPWVAPSYRHGDAELTRTAEAFDRACAVYARAIDKGAADGFLDGRPAQAVFRRFNA